MVDITLLRPEGQEEKDTAMKDDNRTRLVPVHRDSALHSRVRAYEPFTTVRFEDRKHTIATKYGVFWSMISRKIT